ncbi:U2 small nuclear ribonucleoprotein auxiliary factor 35 kDa subunit-related protein 1 [Holothuria leucospilota]|uniref:U2 small nuclear ribonucleoprotein auxiliary factor 35 kDa subunit-related protein 1 n=1 Tax=Holothuria leucospilota TaxID=206669 RepID=A0A9Q1BQ17_HOLLE|nr:U2 small nuclear ribonucleoprotein auxiliary factor 35 kDa subunit-related protein 1 [Holothuria leucospilota]
MDVVTSPHPPHLISRNRCQTRKQHRKLVKREKRRKKRQQAAKARDKEEEENNGPELTPNRQQQLEEREKQLEDLRKLERKRQHELWLERERQAQEEFKRKKEKEEMLKKKEEEERKRIQAEWEEQQKKEQDKLKNEKAKKDEKQHQLEGVLQYLDKEKKNGEEPWRNPDAPATPSDSRKSELCSFFAKTGVCRFGQRCSRSHPDPGVTCTVLLKGMYSNFAMEQSFRDEFDTDISLEYDQETAYQDFLEFYSDVLPEFEKIGKVLILKVCCNWEHHLRGNVYVQFAREEDSSKALEVFNGRYYAGRSLSCEYVAVDDWRAAICGLFPFGRCPKGKNCNYLHTFTNPDNRVSPSVQSHRRSESASYRSGARQDRWHRRREYSARSWRHREASSWRHWSPSKSRSRSRRNSRERRRFHSRSRSRSYSPSRYRSPSRGTSKKRNRSHSKSRSHSRSRSKSKERASSESRSPSRDRSRSRSKSRGRDKHHDYNGNGKGLKERSSKSERRKKSKRRSHSKRKSVSLKEESIKRRKSRRKEKKAKKSAKDVNSEGVNDEFSDDGSDGQKESKTVNSGSDSSDGRDGQEKPPTIDPESDSSDGHEAEVEDSDSSAEENAKLEIVEKEIARLKKRADEKGMQTPSETEGGKEMD